jgi:hypothetical protein
VQETAHARLLGLAIVNQLCLDTLEGSNGQQRLSETSTEASNNGPGTGDLAILILEGCLDSIEGDESYTRQTSQSVTLKSISDNPTQSTPPCIGGIRTNSGLERVSNDQRRTSRIPLLAEWRPGELLALGEAAIELCAGLCDWDGRRQLVRESGEKSKLPYPRVE